MPASGSPVTKCSQARMTSRSAEGSKDGKGRRLAFGDASGATTASIGWMDVSSNALRHAMRVAGVAIGELLAA